MPNQLFITVLFRVILLTAILSPNYLMQAMQQEEEHSLIIDLTEEENNQENKVELKEKTLFLSQMVPYSFMGNCDNAKNSKAVCISYNNLHQEVFLPPPKK